ncbi:MAG: alpha-amylase [Treponematales bacterium]
MARLWVALTRFERPPGGGNPASGGNRAAAPSPAAREFHIRREVREAHGLDKSLFSLQGNVVLADFREVRGLAAKLNAGPAAAKRPGGAVSAGQLNAMGLIDEILHYLVALYREQVRGDVFETALTRLEKNLGRGKTRAMLEGFCRAFPPRAVYGGEAGAAAYLDGSEAGESNSALSLEELLLLALANLNPAFRRFLFLFDDSDLAKETVYPAAVEELKAHLAGLPAFGPDGQSLWDLLRAPALASPDSLAGQLEFMRRRWGLLLGGYMGRLLTGLDVMREEEKPSFSGPGPTEALAYGGMENEYERFSPDQDWMPKTILMAKCTLVWLSQLSKRYGREITRLDQIPDEELDELARRGFTGLWLIGLWERSAASRTIKQWTGNPEAAASAYSLYDYDIAAELGGWGSLVNLRERCLRRGIRLGSDMVPNHTGIDSRWVIEHPDRFLQLPYPPFPGYEFNCGNLSGRDDVTVQIEDHYFTRTDAAVVFRRVDNRTGETRYIYHGNDGTSMPWNDTAQIDFLNPEAREAVISAIIGVCREFPIVRFDAAMTLAKRHIQRLWYPEPGRGGDIASRSEHALSAAEFNRRIPNEFWREVVDRCAAEAPHTLLLAEAFWMMEGYFVRTLGMHRVYNSAFMNMLKKEENGKYRETIRNTLEFDPEILKRFVNFMNNPDEETAAAQFGKGDKYFGVCTLLVTMPGLPMFGHGQIEGFEEKYGMEYRRAYRDEQPDRGLVERHEREIFPLMKKRCLFAGSADFRLYDFRGGDGAVNENVFAYSNRAGDERALVFYNNAYSGAAGWARYSAAARRDGSRGRDSLCEALGLHGEDRFFAVFREQRSGLWFIRSSKEIAERGLFVSLSGYEAQVFLDIHEVEDAAGGDGGKWAGRWARLNHELAGRGTGSLENAAEDIFLAALYEPLNALFSPERAEALGRLTAKAAKPAPHKERAAFLAALEKPLAAFLAAADAFLDGAGGQYEPFPGAPPRRVRKAAAAHEFAAFMERLFRLSALSRAGSGGVSPAAARFLKEAGSRLGISRAAAVVMGYGVLSLLRSVLGGASGASAAALARHWRLGRKLRERFEALGVPGGEAWRAVETAGAVLTRTAPEGGVPAAGRSPAKLRAALLAENCLADDFRRVLGVNRFDGVTWFNKEGFEDALFYGSLFLAAESDAAFAPPAAAKPAKPADRAAALPWDERLTLIAKVHAEMRKAEKASGYKLDALLGA